MKETNFMVIGQIYENIEMTDRKNYSLVFKDCTFKQCSFYDVPMYGWNFENCIFIECETDNVQITRTLFSGCTFYHCQFVHSGIKDSSFIHCKVQNCDVFNTDLEYISLGNGEVDGLVLQNDVYCNKITGIENLFITFSELSHEDAENEKAKLIEKLKMNEARLESREMKDMGEFWTIGGKS